MRSSYYDKNGLVITLDVNNEISHGGEGCIYQMLKYNNARYYPGELIGKIYDYEKIYDGQGNSDKKKTLEQIKNEKARKIPDIIEYCNKPSNKKILEKYRGIIAFPLVAMYEDIERKKLAGFLMYKIQNTDKLSNFCKNNGPTQPAQYRNMKSVINIAKQLCEITKDMHTLGFTIGDFNSDNILISKYSNPGKERVYYIDTDSMNFKDYESRIAKQLFRTPESYSDDYDKMHHPYSDDYVLALHIYQLFTGVYPYQRAGESDINKLIKSKTFPILDKKYEIPRNSVKLEFIPKKLKALFKKSFKEVKKRPGAMKYYKVLKEIEKKGFKVCGRDKSHVFISKLKECPYCEVIKRKD